MTTLIKTFSLPEGPISAYVAEPIESRHVAIVLLPEIYNINGWVRQVAERYAGLGFHVIVPDLFWRQKPNTHLEYTAEDQQIGRELALAVDRHQYKRDLIELIAVWRKTLPAETKIISVGFCIGGELAYLLAGSGAIDAAVAYYPTAMENHLDQGRFIQVPIHIHFGKLDYRTPASLINDVRQSVQHNPHALIEVHEADHGFNRFGHAMYDEKSAIRAQHLTLELADTLINNVSR